MLKNYSSLALIFFLFVNIIISQTTYVPDNNFEQALIDLGYDDVLDDYVLTANISEVILLNLDSKNINDLTGIEDFLNLEELDCRSNQLTYLDVTQNTALEILSCLYNQLTSLDVTQNTALISLYFNSNQLTSLDVSQNTSLIKLGCRSNQLSSLDISNNTVLTDLYCDNNQLSSLDLTQNVALKVLFCYNNQLTNLDVTQNTALFYFSCNDNQLTNLNVTQNTILTNLLFSNNQISSINLTQNTILTDLHCYSNQLSSINLAQNTALSYLQCYSNQLTSIDITQNTALTFLNLNNNQLSSLDVSNNIALTDLYCIGNQLTSLNVKNGNNSLITTFNSTINTSLTCIDVDNEIDANAGTGSYSAWSKDATATYSEDCAALGLNDKILAQSITLYPNPVSNFLTIDSSISISKVEVYSLLGQKVKEINSGFNSIPMGNLSKGMYIVRVQSENGFATKKLIKQ